MLTKPYFEYCRFQCDPRAFQTNANAVRDALAKRAGDAGGTLYGCWQSLVGLGLSRDEGIALTSWTDEPTARSPAGADGIEITERCVLQATVRPTTDAAPTMSGIYVFRWFHLAAADWPGFRDISQQAWPNMEQVFEAAIQGFWLSLDTPKPQARVLLLTQYADLSVWEASRWWKNPTPAANDSMSKFRQRNEVITHTIAYPSLLVSA